MVTLNMHFESTRALTKNKRVASRCILLKNEKVLLSYEENTDQWMIPGGGLEGNESLQDCCAREVVEETGIVVAPNKLFLTINEYFDDLMYINHYFTADYVRETERKLTDEENKNGLVPKWVELNEAIDIFSKYADYEQANPMKCGLYRREHAALSYFKIGILRNIIN